MENNKQIYKISINGKEKEFISYIDKYLEKSLKEVEIKLKIIDLITNMSYMFC